MALADLSPGIVRFYFDSKAAMLVATLAHLATEFEERVLRPVEQLQQRKVVQRTDFRLGPVVSK